MREMKWQINVNRRRPFITGLHIRGGRVYGSASERTSEQASGRASEYAATVHIHTYARADAVCTYVERRRRGLGARTTIYRIGKTISEK